MGLSKREKARRAAAVEEDRLWRLSHRPTPPPPWTAAQLAELDKMKSILETLVYGQTQDINLVFEFLRFSHMFDGSSMRIWDLNRKAKHYMTLQQFAAKDKLWEKMSGILYGLQHELASLRSRRDRGGTSAQ